MLHFDNYNISDLKDIVLKMRYGDTLRTHFVEIFSDFSKIAAE